MAVALQSKAGMTSDPDPTGVLPDPGASIPLLQTKLNVPRSGSGLVARPRLTERLAKGTAGRLTVVSAPAGFGKTTLLAQWLADSTAEARGIAWVSLDPSENDPALFWAYVIQALSRLHPAIGVESLPRLRSARDASMASVLTVLLNEISAIDSDVTLLLDDYHVIDTKEVHDGVAFLIDHQPARMHVVLATRFDPPLPLSRLRARGELTELPVAELRFTPGEASAFLNDIMSLELSNAEVAELEGRTEGWITALKLAALSGTGPATAAGESRAFRGGNGYIADYVIDEVLRAEPEDVRSFLLATSALERMSGPLCDEVADQRESRRLLHDLAQRNLFVVALDDEGTWYRYHHLFAEVLRASAAREDPEILRRSHRRASRWYENNGSRLDAVAHALEAGDAERAADLLELEWPEKNRSFESVRWLRHARTLPEKVLAKRPVLSMAYAWALLNSGEPEAAEAPLRHVEEWLTVVNDGGDGAAARGGMIVMDPERYRALPAELASARGYLAQMSGDASGTIEHARRALDLVPETDDAARATGTALLALALWSSGRLEEAYDTFDSALTSMRRAGRTLDAIRGMFVLGDLRVAQGRLGDAASIYEAGLRQAGDHDDAAAAETDELYLGLAEVHCERGDPEVAESFLERLHDSWARARHAGNRQRRSTAMALIRELRGDLDGALSHLSEAATVDLRSPLPQPRPIAAMKARIRISQGRLPEALAWVEAARVSPQDDLTYGREFEHLTLARVLLAQHRAGERDRALLDAAGLLQGLGAAAERDGRKGSLIEALALRALARHAAGDVRGALDPLVRSLTLAESEGFVRVFVAERTPMRDLLRHAIARGAAPEYAQRLLSALEPAPAGGADASQASDASARLTSREEVILRLLAAGLRNQEIAEHLFISPATVKRHVANVYLKLGVGHRMAALARAAELKLL